MTKDEVISIFTLAGIEVLHCWEINNRYWGSSYRTNPDISSWWLAKTQVGIIEIGWRKRVISIHWEDTSIKQIVTEDDVTKDVSGVHAYSVPKAVEYLTELRKQFSTISKFSYIGESPKTKFAALTLKGLHPASRKVVLKQFCIGCGEVLENCSCEKE